MPKRITIAIAEDQTLVRKALISLLEENNQVRCIAEAGNGRELLDLLKTQQPHIVLLDIDMPVMNGRQTLELIKKRFPGVKVIMLSIYNDQNYISEFMAMGANAYLPKNSDVEVLMEAIQTVKEKGIYISPAVSNALLNGLRQEKNINPLFDELSLTARETDILKIICEGKTNKEIAEQLHISASTVDFHRGNIYTKTKSKNVTDLVKYAIKNGIITV
ncbi:MAG TPA: response regulator transcription factor [Bacteroidia bacterium]